MCRCSRTARAMVGDPVHYDRSGSGSGLLKMDFLGLRTLTVIHDAARAANIDINTIDINDSAVYKLFAAGKTEGIFQFESAGHEKKCCRSCAPLAWNT